jgi:hypothetical protein
MLLDTTMNSRHARIRWNALLLAFTSILFTITLLAERASRYLISTLAAKRTVK